MQTILLTGGTGYLGSHLAKGFVKAGHRVAILTRKTSNFSRINLILPNLNVFAIEDGLERPFRTLGVVDAIVHTATHYGRDGEPASELFESNTAFPVNLLETAGKFGSHCFFNTDTILNPYVNAYALSKFQFSEWGRFFSGAEAMNFINIRLEHFYGAGDDSRKFPTFVIRNCLSNTPEIKLTPGEQKRDFVHIDDVVSAYLCMFEKRQELGLGFQEVGLGSGKIVSISDFAKKIHQLTESKSKLLFGALPYRNNESMKSCADTSRLEGLGWRCHLSLEHGLQKTIDLERAA